MESMNFVRRLNTGEKLFLAFGAIFLLYLVISAAGRSSVRQGKSILGAASPETIRETLNQGDQSKLQLQTFYRVQIERGKQLWEIRATDAKYFPEQDITFVSDATIKIERKSGDHMTIKSRSARLHLKGENLLRADLEGNVIVEDERQNVVHSELAAYDAEQRMVTIPGAARVDGPGYFIDAIGLDMAVDSDQIHFLKDVKSKFERGATPPAIPIESSGK